MRNYILFNPINWRQYFPIAKYISNAKLAYKTKWNILFVPIQLLLVGSSYIIGSSFNLIVWRAVIFADNYKIRRKGLAKTVSQRKKIKTQGKQNRKTIRTQGKQERKKMSLRSKLIWSGIFTIILLTTLFIFRRTQVVGFVLILWDLLLLKFKQLFYLSIIHPKGFLIGLGVLILLFIAFKIFKR